MTVVNTIPHLFHSKPQAKMVSLLKTFLLLGVIGPLIYLLDQRFLPSQYIFEPAKLQDISKRAIAQHGNSTNPEPLLRQITRELREEYGDAIRGEWDREDWFFNNAGGAMVCIRSLYPSYCALLPGFGVRSHVFGRLGLQASSSTPAMHMLTQPGNHGHSSCFHQRVLDLLRHGTPDRRTLRRTYGR